jgi:hypothetical protein
LSATARRNIFFQYIEQWQKSKIKPRAEPRTLHYVCCAIKELVPDDVILKTLAANEDAAKQPNLFGDLPLNLVIKKELSDKFKLAVVAANEDAAKQRDDYGVLPLHNAIKSVISDQVIISLIHAYQNKDTSGALPLNLVIQCKLSDEVILAVLAVNTDAVKTVDKNGESPNLKILTSIGHSI